LKLQINPTEKAGDGAQQSKTANGQLETVAEEDGSKPDASPGKKSDQAGPDGGADHRPPSRDN